MRLPFVGLAVGSTSAFMAVIAAAFDVLDDLTPAEKAAAALGIYTDTSALLHGATPLDFKMFELLTRSEETQDILDELRDYRVPPEWYHLPRRGLPQPGGHRRRARRAGRASCATSTAT